MNRKAFPMPPAVIDAAAEWLVQLRFQEVSADTRAAFADWLRASPVHVQAYLEMASVWVDAAHLRRDLASSVEVEDSGVVRLPTHRTLPPKSASSRTMGRIASRITASIAAAAVLGTAVMIWRLQASTYSVNLGEQRIVTLEDGSVARLNSRARMRVHFDTHLRTIDLLEGQALFTVQKDPARPFLVHSGKVTVRAVGTEFDVFRQRVGTLVTVLEGRVLVNSPSTPSMSPASGGSSAVLPGSIPLAAGEQLKVAADGAVKRLPHADVANATSWMRQELVFDGQPLAEVTESLNQYTRKPIVITDPSLADLRVTAVFHSTSTSALLGYVRRLPGVDVEEVSGEIRIARSKSPSPTP